MSVQTIGRLLSIRTKPLNDDHSTFHAIFKKHDRNHNGELDEFEAMYALIEVCKVLNAGPNDVYRALAQRVPGQPLDANDFDEIVQHVKKYNTTQAVKVSSRKPKLEPARNLSQLALELRIVREELSRPSVVDSSPEDTNAVLTHIEEEVQLTRQSVRLSRSDPDARSVNSRCRALSKLAQDANALRADVLSSTRASGLQINIPEDTSCRLSSGSASIARQESLRAKRAADAAELSVAAAMRSSGPHDEYAAPTAASGEIASRQTSSFGRGPGRLTRSSSVGRAINPHASSPGPLTRSSSVGRAINPSPSSPMTPQEVYGAQYRELERLSSFGTGGVGGSDGDSDSNSEPATPAVGDLSSHDAGTQLRGGAARESTPELLGLSGGSMQATPAVGSHFASRRTSGDLSLPGHGRARISLGLAHSPSRPSPLVRPSSFGASPLVVAPASEPTSSDHPAATSGTSCADVKAIPLQHNGGTSCPPPGLGREMLVDWGRLRSPSHTNPAAALAASRSVKNMVGVLASEGTPIEQGQRSEPAANGRHSARTSIALARAREEGGSLPPDEGPARCTNHDGNGERSPVTAAHLMSPRPPPSCLHTPVDADPIPSHPAKSMVIDWGRVRAPSITNPAANLTKKGSSVRDMLSVLSDEANG